MGDLFNVVIAFVLGAMVVWYTYEHHKRMKDVDKLLNEARELREKAWELHMSTLEKWRKSIEASHDQE